MQRAPESAFLRFAARSGSIYYTSDGSVKPLFTFRAMTAPEKSVFAQPARFLNPVRHARRALRRQRVLPPAFARALKVLQLAHKGALFGGRNQRRQQKPYKNPLEKVRHKENRLVDFQRDRLRNRIQQQRGRNVNDRPCDNHQQIQPDRVAQYTPRVRRYEEEFKILQAIPRTCKNPLYRIVVLECNDNADHRKI